MSEEQAPYGKMRDQTLKEWIDHNQPNFVPHEDTLEVIERYGQYVKDCTTAKVLDKCSLTYEQMDILMGNINDISNGEYTFGQLLALKEAHEEYIEFLGRVISDKEWIAVTHPHLGTSKADIDKGTELRAKIETIKNEKK